MSLQRMNIMARMKNRTFKTVSRLLIFAAVLWAAFACSLSAADSDTDSYFSEQYIQEIIQNTPATDPVPASPVHSKIMPGVGLAACSVLALCAVFYARKF